MPELPEVETIARGLKTMLLGRTILSVNVLGPVVRSPVDAFASSLEGQTISTVHRHGKFLFLELKPSARYLKIHLGMSGQLLFESADTPPRKHTHVIIELEGLSEELRYRDFRRFGFLAIVNNIKTNLGPDAWTSPDEIIFSTLRKKTGMLKNTLLNQGVVAGLGNIYVDESLYRTKLHPRRRLETLSSLQLKALCGSIRAVLKESIRSKGTTISDYRDINGGSGGFDKRLRVYGRDGQTCDVCLSIIKKAVVAGRGTHFCPRCQRKPKKR